MLEAEAKERQLSTLKQNATDPEKFPERNEEDITVVEKFPQRDEGKSRDHAAKITGTNSRYVSDAKAIKEKAPELVEVSDQVR